MGIILDQKLRFLVHLAQNPIFPQINNILDLGYSIKSTEKFCQNLKFILFNRLETNCKKDGKKLWIGSLERTLYEDLFTKWNGKRSVKIYKKGKSELDYGVFIIYEFAKEAPFLSEIPKKVQYVDEFVNNSHVIRQVTHFYTCLSLLLDVQTNNVHVQWEQDTEKYEGEEEKKQTEQKQSEQKPKETNKEKGKAREEEKEATEDCCISLEKYHLFQ